MLVAAAVCPHPPVLIPDAMGRAGHDAAGSGPDDASIRALRAACRAAAAALAATEPDLLAVVGGADRPAGYPGSAAGTLAGFGVPFRTGHGPAVLPLSLTIGAWLIREHGGCPPGAGRGEAAAPADGPQAGPPRPASRLIFQSVAWSAPPAECSALGARLATLADRVALLVMGDGSARKVLGPPGQPDPDAERYDRAAAAALAAADARALAALDSGLAARCLAAGHAAWQVLAGAALAAGHGDTAIFDGRLTYCDAPLGVAYLVASWDQRPAGPS